MQQTLDSAQIIQRMGEELNLNSGVYPLLTTGSQWKRFRNRFCEFVRELGRACKPSTAIFTDIEENITPLLIGLSVSPVSDDFRYFE